MNKQILEEYIDACKLIKETEKEIQRLNQKKRTIIQTNLSGSNSNFPYQSQHLKINTMTVKDDAQLRYEEKLLKERIARAEKAKLQLQQFLNTAPPRMQRIICMRYFDGKTWGDVAKKLGRKATADSVRMEVKRFLKEN